MSQGARPQQAAGQGTGPKPPRRWVAVAGEVVTGTHHDRELPRAEQTGRDHGPAASVIAHCAPTRLLIVPTGIDRTSAASR